MEPALTPCPATLPLHNRVSIPRSAALKPSVKGPNAPKYSMAFSPSVETVEIPTPVHKRIRDIVTMGRARGEVADAQAEAEYVASANMESMTKRVKIEERPSSASPSSASTSA